MRTLPALLTTIEAANALRVHPQTLTRAARAGRVRGAHQISARAWRFDADRLMMVPAAGADARPDVAPSTVSPARRTHPSAAEVRAALSF